MQVLALQCLSLCWLSRGSQWLDCPTGSPTASAPCWRRGKKPAGTETAADRISKQTARDLHPVLFRTLIADKGDSLVQCADFRGCLPSQDAPVSSGPLAVVQGRNLKYGLNILTFAAAASSSVQQHSEPVVSLQRRSVGVPPLLHASPPAAERDARLPGESAGICSDAAVVAGVSLLAAHLCPFSCQWRYWPVSSVHRLKENLKH